MPGRRRVSSSSRSGGAVHELTHDWTITGYDFIKGYQIERFNSPPFKFYGFEWFIQFYPHGTSDNRENVAIFLIGKELPKAEILCSYIQFSVINQSDDSKTLCPRPYYYVLSGKDTKHNHSNSGGHINVIKSVDLHEASRGFIGEDGTLRIRLTLKISCLDPTLCPHTQDPRTGECRMSMSPDTSMMDIQDDSAAQQAGLLPSLKSLLANEVCTDVELRVAVKPSTNPTDSRRPSFKPFAMSQTQPCSHDVVSSSTNSRETLNTSLSHIAPSARNTNSHNSGVSPEPHIFSSPLSPLSLNIPNDPQNFVANMSLDLDTTRDENEFSDSMSVSPSMNDSNISTTSLCPQHGAHPSHSTGGFSAQPSSPPPRASTRCSGSLVPRTPNASMAAHAGPTTPAPLVDSESVTEHSNHPAHFSRAAPTSSSHKTRSSSPSSNMDKRFYSHQAHKCILASRSPVFRAMFSLRMRESVSNVVEIEDMRPQVLDAFLAYIYSDEEPDLQLAPEMLVVADKYQMPGLLHTCECVLARSLTVENCISALIFADRYTFGCPHLRETTVNFVCDNLPTVCRSPAFVELMKIHTDLAHEIVCENARQMSILGADRHSIYSTQ